MLKPNTENSNSQLLATQKSPSNTPLHFNLPLSLSNNSLHSFSLYQNKAKVEIKSIDIHLDYLRFSGTLPTKKSFDSLLAKLAFPIPCFENKISWHPHLYTPKIKQYENKLESFKGGILGYTRRLLNNSKKPKYVYDIMIDLKGTYFANLSLLEQQELIYYLNSNFQLKCHRIDVAIDDYSRKLFPVGKMITAYLENNHFGFKIIDDSYLDIIDNKLLGTLGIGSRRSSFFIRIYTKHQNFVRWETELKQKKAQELFDKLAKISTNKDTSILLVENILKTLIKAALGKLDFRDKNTSSLPKIATKNKTKRLSFWSIFTIQIYSIIDKQTISYITKYCCFNS